MFYGLTAAQGGRLLAILDEIQGMFGRVFAMDMLLVADEFFAEHGYRVLELPTGQGLVVL